MKKLSNDEFLKKLNEKNIKYQPLEEYKNGKTKIKFLCDKHGEFFARPNDILNGQGCPYCGGTKKMTTNDFIEKAKKVHNNFFNYEKTKYISSNEKVLITCPIHGDFWQKANNHLNGYNCPLCSKQHIKHEIKKLEKSNSSTKKLTTEIIIEKIKNQFGDKYNTDKVVYKTNRDKIILGCPIHGDFTISPNHLFNGRGCPKCAKNYKYTTKEFIDLCKKIFGDKYIYDKVKYVSTHKNIILICPIHGEFEILPSNLLKGEGCPFCKTSKLENIIKEILIKNDINFNYNKFYDFLNNLQLDFYIPSKNIAIECQGLQHFEPITFFGGEKSFIKTVERDRIKKELCENNGIKLLYYSNVNINYPYKVFTNTEELLKEILK